MSVWKKTTRKTVSFCDEEVVSRLSGRRVCKACGKNYHTDYMKPAKEGVCDKCGGELFTREDDKIESISKRLDVYRAQTAPLIAYYRERNLLKDIDARPASEVILENFKAVFPPEN